MRNCELVLLLLNTWTNETFSLTFYNNFLQYWNSILYILQIIFFVLTEKIFNARWDKLIRNVYRQWLSKCLLWEVWIDSPSRLLFIFNVKDLRLKKIWLYINKSIYLQIYYFTNTCMVCHDEKCKARWQCSQTNKIYTYMY